MKVLVVCRAHSFSSDNGYVSDRKQNHKTPLFLEKKIQPKTKPRQLLKENCWKETSGGNANPISILSSGYHNLHFPVFHQTTSQWNHTSEYGLQATFMKHGNHYVWFCFLREYIRNISYPLVISLILAWNPRYAQIEFLHKLQIYVRMEAGISNEEPHISRAAEKSLRQAIAKSRTKSW